MITLKVETKFRVGFGFNQKVEKSIRCEQCLGPIPIFSYTARICPHCKTLVPNVLRMEDSLESRIKFHYRKGLAFGGMELC